MGDLRLTLGAWSTAFAAVACLLGAGATAYLFYGGATRISETESQNLVSGLLAAAMLPICLVAFVLAIVALRRPKISTTGTVAAVGGLVLSIVGTLASPIVMGLALLIALIAGVSVVH